ncbi:MAG TPA: hypothetical protein VHO67_13275 [Polyangia bacterium]|nr:hypothetical protein [Polyangia bacterium]
MGEPSCGQEMAASAEVPLQWQALMDHVAGNMDAHATWVGTATPAAKQEHDALRRVAAAYRAMAWAASSAAQAMRAMAELPPAPHDPRKRDGAAWADWMREKIRMQRQLAATLERHAAESEHALAAHR